MPTNRDQIIEYIAQLNEWFTPEEAEARLKSDPTQPVGGWIRPSKNATTATLNAGWRTILARTDATEEDKAFLADPDTLGNLSHYSANIENLVGTVKMPVGVIGPMRVNGLHAKGDFYVPLATTEAALVASYGRGAHVISLAGGAVAAMLSEGVIRSPVFAFASIYDAGMFCSWVAESFDMLKVAAESTTRHGKLIDITPEMEGDHVYLVCRYSTGDASGQNMVTIATEAVCETILTDCPHRPTYWFLEGNFSGDKKASSLAFLTGRGRRVTASVTLSAQIVEERLHTTIRKMLDYWRMSAIGGVMSGTIGIQGHVANGLAALYIATGQDAACVAESSVGVTRMEERGDALYVSVTLPNLMLGTVGGGTGLPSQAAGLRVLGLQGDNKAGALAEVAGALCLAGEISIIAALSAGQFAKAHKTLGRDRR